MLIRKLNQIFFLQKETVFGILNKTNKDENWISSQ